MCRAGWALHTRLLISFANCVRRCSGAGTAMAALSRAREGRAGAAHWGAPSGCPEVPAVSPPSGFPSGQLLKAPHVCCFPCCGVGAQSSQAGKGQCAPSSYPCPVLLLSTDTAQGTSLCCLHHSKMHVKGQSFLLIQPASVTQPGPSSRIFAPSF